jgi:TolB protein
MKPFATKALRTCVWTAFFVLNTAGIPTNGIPTNGIPTNGIPTNGIPTNGIPTNGIPTNGIPTNGIPTNGIPTNGIPTNGLGLELLEQSLLFANQKVHEAFIGQPFTRATLTDPRSPVFQVWSDPYSTLLLSYLWQDAHRFGDDFAFVAPSGNTFHFYGNLGLCDNGTTGWAVNGTQDDACARWMSAAIIAQINQGGAHNLLSVRGPSSKSDTSFIGTQLTIMSPAMHSFDYKFGTREPVEALHDVCAHGTTGVENCGWQPGLIGTGTPGALVKVSLLPPPDLKTANVPMVAQVNQGIMGHDYPFAAKGSCFNKPADCVDVDVLAFSVGKVVNPSVQFTIPPSGVFNVQWSTWSRDDLGLRTESGPIVDQSKVPKMVAQVIGPTGLVQFPANEMDIFPSKNREMTTAGNIFGSTKIDPGLWSCEARSPTSTASTGTSAGYTFASVSAPGASITSAYKINDVGEIVGVFEAPPTVGSSGYIRTVDGSVTPINAPAQYLFANTFGINNAGQMVGALAIAGNQSTGFVRSSDGSFTPFDLPVDFHTATLPGLTPFAINDGGQIVGYFSNAVGLAEGFLRNADGTFEHIQFPGATTTLPTGINNLRHIVGVFSNGTGDHGFVRDAAGSYAALDLPGAFAGTTVARGINDAGDVVGTVSLPCANPVTGLPDSCTRGFMRRPDGSFTAFEDPAALPSTTEPIAINSNGDIVGRIRVSASPLHIEGFLATLRGTQLCDASNQTNCIPCTRTFTPGATHVIFPDAHMWLSKSWNNAQDYYRNRSCSADFSTCIATFEGFIDAPFLNPATGQTVPACLQQSADNDSTQPPLSYPGPARPLNDADSCFIGANVNTGFTITTFFPNYRDGGPCGAVASAKGCSYTSPTRIAFSSGRTGNGDIYVMDGDGKNARVIATDPAVDFSPSISPDGNKIVFVSTRSGNGDIYLADVNNPAAPPLRLAGGAAVDAHPVWSPTGDRIAFVSTRTGNGDVYVVNIDGTRLTNVTNHPAVDSEPVFSPDGSRIVFVSTRTGGGDLYLVNLSDPTLKAVRLTDSPSSDFGPVFSPGPQAETVAFVRGSNSGDIYLLDVATKAVTLLAPSAAADFSPVFSPDGKRIAFVSSRSGNSDIWLVKLNGSELRNLTNHPAQDFAPVFSPDGKQVAYVSIRSGNSDIFAIDVETGVTTNLTNRTAVDAEPSWR